MEWVVTTGKTIDEAKDAALDQLGVDENDAEFEVLEEPKTGLFGRVRSEAQVRARVRPTEPRPKVERRDRKRRGKGDGDRPTAAATDDGGAAGATGSAPNGGRGRGGRTGGGGRAATTTPAGDASAAPESAAGTSGAPSDRKPSSDRSSARPSSGGSGRGQKRTFSEEITNMSDQQTTIVDFVQGVVDAFALGGTLESSSTDEEINVNVVGDDLGLLVGPRGATLQSIQDLARAVLQRHFPDDRHARVRIDVGGYRERRRAALERFVNTVAEEVRGSGRQKALEPMSSADRKVVHDTANDLDGVHTVSEGYEPNRRVVILPGDGD